MRILFNVGSLYPAQIGGPDNVTYWWAKSMVKQGHAVTITTTDDGINGQVPLDQWFETDYGRVIYVKTAVHFVPFRLLVKSLAPLWRTQILHVGAIFYPTSWLLATIGLILGKKVIWTPHGELDPPALVYSTARKKPILWFIKNFLASRVLFHSTCDAETDYIRHNFGLDTAIVQIPPKMELPEPLDRPTERYLLFIGRLHPKKNVENLIEAVAHSAEFQRSDFTLKLAGMGDPDYVQKLRDKIAALGISEKVSFLGLIAGAAKQELLARAYFSFMPSHTENFGIVVTEALAHGTPVVASRSTPWAVLQQNRSGYWVENSVPSLTHTIDTILNLDPEIYRQMRRNSVETSYLFDIGRHGQDWVTIYEDLLSGDTEHRLPFRFA